MRRLTAIIAGAGFSAAAGLPLGNALLQSSNVPVDKLLGLRLREVARSFEEWRSHNPNGTAEEFLGFLYTLGDRVTFTRAVELITMHLVSAQRSGAYETLDHLRFQIRVAQPTRCDAHLDLLDVAFAKSDLRCIATTNYDLLLERALRHRKVHRWSSPGFYYGGLARPQALRGRSAGTRGSVLVLEGTLPLYKLHGSLSWDRSGDALILFEDMRPVFGGRSGPAIVPPVPEKDIPTWLAPIWHECEVALNECDHWIVIGYSLPPYDSAVRRMVSRAGSRLRYLSIVDPNASALVSRWQGILPSTTTIFTSEGLPLSRAALSTLFERVSGDLPGT
jgi:hypothetical protein